MRIDQAGTALWWRQECASTTQNTLLSTLSTSYKASNCIWKRRNTDNWYFIRYTSYKSSCLLAVKVAFCSLRVLKDLLSVRYDKLAHIAALSFCFALAITVFIYSFLLAFLLFRGFLLDLVRLSLELWLECFTILERLAFGLRVRIASALSSTIRDLALLGLLEEVFVDHGLDGLKLEENVAFSSLSRFQCWRKFSFLAFGKRLHF